MSEWYVKPVGSFTLVAILTLALVLLLTFVGLPKHRVSGRRRSVLFGLRLLVIGLLLLAMLRPTLVFTLNKKQAATLVLLVDRSRSMQVADSFGGRARFETLKLALKDALPALRELSPDIEVKLYTFDSEVHAADFTGKLDLDSVPDGEQTAIGSALEDVLRRESGKRLAGVLLLSDGAQRAYAPRDVSPQTPARRLADLGWPLYTFTFGQSRGLGQARDVAIKELTVNQTVFVKNELAVLGTARLDGFANQKLPVQLLFESPGGKMQVVGTQQLQSGKDGESLPITLSYVPENAGEYKVTLQAPKQPGELVTTNNQLSTFVTVLKGGLNVLYLEGALRVEQKFLRRSLDASADIKVDYLRVDPKDSKNRPVDLLDRFQPGKYDVYILGDLDSTAFTKEELQSLAKVVSRGAGLIMLGGFHTFGPGGYGDTPLKALLPVQMSPLERQRFEDPIRPQLHQSGPLKMLPAAPLGTRHYVMLLAAPAENQAAWSKLPALEGANLLGPLKPNAQVLAETADRKPLLVAAEAGGRVMAFAADSTWHWWLEGFEAQHKRFWRQAVVWLARKDEQTEGSVWIKLAQRRFGPGGRVEFTVGARTPELEPVTDASFDVEIILPDGARRKVSTARGGEQMSGLFNDARMAGDYTVVATATKNGAQLGVARARFLVYEQDLELDNAVADPTLMASLAKMTLGGQSLPPEELSKLIEDIRQRPPELEVETQEKESPWDTWPFFSLFVGILCCEWYLRKKWGLV